MEGRGWAVPRGQLAPQGTTPFNPWVGQGGATPGRIAGSLSKSSRAAWAASVLRVTAPPQILSPGDMPQPNPLGEEKGAGNRVPTGGTETTGSSQAPTLVTTGEEPPPAQAMGLGLGASDSGAGTEGKESEGPPGAEEARGDEPMGGGEKEGGLPTAEGPRQLRVRNPSGNRQHAVFHEQEGTTRRPKAVKKGAKKGKGKGKGEAPSRKET